MCEWCHVVLGHGQVKLLSVQVGDRRRLGLYLCSDLGCVSEGPRVHRRICEFAARRVF